MTSLEAFSEAVDHRTGPKRLRRRKPAAAFVRFCARHRVPAALRTLFERHAYTSAIQFGAATFFAVAEMPAQNGGDERLQTHARCIAERLLIVGCARNGDPIVVDLKTQTMGYVRHDDFYENDDEPARDQFVSVPVGIGRFFLDAAKAAAKKQPRETREANGATALHHAALHHRITIIEALVAAGADVNCKDAKGSTPLHYAARNPKSDASVVTALVRAGARVDAADAEGNTPLFEVVMAMREHVPRSARSGGPVIARALIACGADKTKRNRKRVSPATLASDIWRDLTRWLA